jgi:predicted nuclease with TOPRIM domain
VPPWLAVLSGAVSLGVILGGAYAVLRSNISTKTTELWKSHAEALEERLTYVEGENKRLGELFEASRGRIQTLEAANQLLSQQIGAGPAIESLARQMNDNHKEVMSELKGRRG